MAISESRKGQIAKGIEELNLTQKEAESMLIGTLVGIEHSVPGTDMLTATVATVRALRAERIKP